MTYMKILLLLMFCTVLPMQAQQMKKLTDLKDFEARLLQVRGEKRCVSKFGRSENI